jgi:predicted protein tyrosine phosphatase
LHYINCGNQLLINILISIKSMALEGNEVYYTFQGQAMDGNMLEDPDEVKVPKEEALRKFIKFVREWSQDNKFIYK